MLATLQSKQCSATLHRYTEKGQVLLLPRLSLPVSWPYTGHCTAVYHNMVWPEGNWPARHLLFLATHGYSAYIKLQHDSEHNRNYGLTNGRPSLYCLDPFVNPLTLNLSIMTRRYGPLYGSSSSSCIGFWP